MESTKIEAIIAEAERKNAALFAECGKVALFNQKKVLDAFRSVGVAARHFAPSTGYGYADIGKVALSDVFAKIFRAERALVSPLLTCGTHSLFAALSAILDKGDTLLSITGDPYDTLTQIITGDKKGTFKSQGINYFGVAMPDGKPDFAKIKAAITDKKPKVVFVTRSRGYNFRSALLIDELKELFSFIRNIDKNTIIFCDNCYGELVDTREPLEVGAELVVGSLIKNPGGGLAPTGGYVAGKSELVVMVEEKMTAPYLGAEVGSYNASYLPFFQGLFLAPSVVAAAKKTALLLSAVFDGFGYEVSPKPYTQIGDILVTVKLKSKDAVTKFCKAVQFASPVDSFASPEFDYMPGYKEDIIMAAGTFVQGSSIEISCDGPDKEPYCVYIQGGLTYEHGRIVTAEILEKL
ncbi:MAG: methionine gamma-lyase family protein [Christensenellaceae bacterium]|jgi:cystathionine beta-lyase family protein involved in aluminum resistance|nr:methionine gamma-lyase family protein [Christensenellaceae bacterium]